MFNYLILIVLYVLFYIKLVNGERPPNILVLFADDQGYGDLSINGHPTIYTPNIDRLALSGMRFSQFYSGAPVCSPSRAALMTGRYPVRSGCAGFGWNGSFNTSGVFRTDSVGGLPPNEITFAEVLKENGYHTEMVGKWHLGVLPQFMPLNHGFDAYHGIPYSVDMGSSAWKNDNPTWHEPGHEPMPPLPMMNNDSIQAQPANLNNLTESYTNYVINFLKKQTNGDKPPFLMYLSYNHMHEPLFYNKKYINASRRGDFGDASMELDDSIGNIMNIIENNQYLDENTIVFYLSDNGAWVNQGIAGGSSGLFFEGKGTTFEGGIRVPFFVRWTNHIKPYTLTQSVGHTIDLFATILSVANIKYQPKNYLDSKDLSPIFLNNNDTSPHDCLYLYNGTPVWNNIEEYPGLWAIRCGKYKAHYVTGLSTEGRGSVVKYTTPLLFQIENDPSERHPLNTSLPINQKVIEYINYKKQIHEQTLDTTVTNQMELGNDPGNIICCDPESTIKLPTYPNCTCTPQNFVRESAEVMEGNLLEEIQSLLYN